MNELPAHIELRCPGCSARFRVKAKGGRLPTKPMRCPKCATLIPVPKVEAGVKDMSRAQVFGRTDPAPKPTPASVAPEPKRRFKDITTIEGDVVTDPTRETTRSEVEAARAAYAAEQAESERAVAAAKKDRETAEVQAAPASPTAKPLGRIDIAKKAVPVKPAFTKEHTKIDTDPLRPLGSIPETAEVDVPESLDELDEPNLLAPSDEEQENPHGDVTALPPAIREALAAKAKAAAVDSEKPTELAEESAVVKPQKITAPARTKREILAAKFRAKKDRIPRAPENKERPFNQELPARDPTSEIPTALAELMAQESSAADQESEAQEIPALTASDLEHGVRAKIDKVIYGPINIDGLVKLLKSGIWAGVVELEAGGVWVPMRQHPIFALVEEELSSEAHNVMQTLMTPPEPDPPAPATVPLGDVPSWADEADAAGGPFSGLFELDQAGDIGPQPPGPKPPQLPPAARPNALDVQPDEAPAPPPVQTPARDAQYTPVSYSQAAIRVPEADEAPIPPAIPTAPDATSSVELMIQPQGDKSIGAIKGLLGFFAFVAIAGLAVLYITQENKQEPPEPTPLAPPREAIQAGLLVVNKATGVSDSFAALRKQTTAELEASVKAAIDKANYGDALETTAELVRRQPENLKFVRLRHEALMGAREYGEARLMLIDATAHIGDADELRQLFVQAVRQDPALNNEIVTIGGNEKVDSIKKLGGGRSISFKMKRDGENIYAFKPAQAEWENRWRAEVAAWRLCQVLACEFQIPHSRSARVSRKDFEALYPMDSGKQTRYAERFENLWWTSDATEGEEYLYGVLKAWVPHFTDFPIEYTHIWQDWLDATGDAAVLDKPLKTAIRGLFVYKDGEYYRKILRERRDASTRQVARQLSNVLLFDYLTNNWDRFSAVEEYYGVNNQFADGSFVSIDNGACFHEQTSARVDARFEPVERVSKRFVTSLGLLDPEWLNPILYPDADEMEQHRLEVFWQRREEVLTRVNELARRYGEEKIYVFR